MKKHVFAIVVGYMHHEMYQEVSEAVRKYHPLQAPSIQTGIHIYEYSSEGIINNLVTNYPLPEGTDVGYILCEASEIDAEAYESGMKEAGLQLYTDPKMTEGYDETPALLYLGAMLGYDEDGTDRYEE